MADIRHRVGINAPINQVFDRLGTTEGLATWWTSDVTGEATEGGELDFRFGRPDPWVIMKVTDHVAPTLVRWRCILGPDEWLDTTITFELRENGDETTLVFTHGEWREPVEFLHHCSTKWGYFLLGLKDGFEGGKSMPWPDDAPMSTWG